MAGVRDSLRNDFYLYPALPPVMPWLDNVNPNAPRELAAKLVSKGVEISWKEPVVAADGDCAYGYVIYRFEKGEKIDIEKANHIIKISYSSIDTKYTDLAVSANHTYTYLVTAIDRLKNESKGSNNASINVLF